MAFTLIIPDEGYSRNPPCALNLIFSFLLTLTIDNFFMWTCGSWIYNYLCNQYLSPLPLWVRTPLRRDVLDTTLCDQVCQWLATGQGLLRVLRFPPPIKHDITEILHWVYIIWCFIDYEQFRHTRYEVERICACF